MKKLLLVSTFVFALPSLASAMTPAGGACKAEAQSICKGTKPGGGRMLACLKANMAKLSPECQTQTKEWPKAKTTKPAAAAPAPAPAPAAKP